MVGLSVLDEVDTWAAGLEPMRALGVVSLTRHARKRGARRNVAPDAVEYVLEHGRMIRRTGVLFFFLGRRDIPPCDRCASWASRLEGVIVIVSHDGAVITVYRDRRGLHAIERKMKYRLRACAQPSTDEGADQGAISRMALASA